eukprot:1313763-Pyramimonas_sp.AAC.1
MGKRFGASFVHDVRVTHARQERVRHRESSEYSSLLRTTLSYNLSVCFHQAAVYDHIFANLSKMPGASPKRR